MERAPRRPGGPPPRGRAHAPFLPPQERTLPVSPHAPIQVQLVRHFDVPVERVFDAWVDAKLLGQWMFGPRVRDEQVVHLHLDARVGGTFSFLVRRRDMDIDHIGTYLEVDRPHRLVFTWAIREDNLAEEDISRVSLEFRPQGTGCELTLTHVMSSKWAEYADRTQAGWAAMLTALTRALAAPDALEPRHG
nr:SRPBCC family protein [Myxococcus sp. CA051A]